MALQILIEAIEVMRKIIFYFSLKNVKLLFFYIYTAITIPNNARRSELRNERRVTPDVLSPAGVIRSEAVQRDTGRAYASLGRAEMSTGPIRVDLEERYHS